jgi:hypothetical protein
MMVGTAFGESSAHGTSDLVQSQNAGIDHHLIKPVQVEALTTLLSGVARPSPHSA